MARSSDSGSVAERLRVSIQGAVQGVGFRPYIYALARSLSLTGWVHNSVDGVTVEVEGPRGALDEFLERLEPERPPRASIHAMESTFLDAVGYDTFEIRASDAAASRVRTAVVMPDIASCEDCVREAFDPADRRHGYPFTNCTNCGPRFSIIDALPYDRANTTMRGFAMCETCRAEYEDPSNRRFHAQPNACPECGPRIELWNGGGRVLEVRDGALEAAVDALRRGEIVALKGLGGFHLLVDARDQDAVARLRERKRRERKPLALMYPSLEAVERDCRLEPQERRVLLSAAAPIVLARRRAGAVVADAVAPGNPYLGVMLPYTPLHHLLLFEFGAPLVATSGNLSDEPICTDEREALARLGDVADAFLVHDRPITRHVDDSVVRVVAGREQVLRRARGYAPLSLRVAGSEGIALAVGAHLKNAVALAVGERAFASQHVGDLDTETARRAFEDVVDSLERLYDARPGAVVCDGHPGYASSQYAEGTGLPVRRVQHHVAHVLSCMADNDIEPPVLGVSWDGTGQGTDGTVWGGEFFHVTAGATRRVAHLRTFSLPGGEQAIREPRRAAFGVLHEIGAVAEAANLPWAASFSEEERRVIAGMLRADVNCPRTSSAGRLFDAIASLLGVEHVNHFEGQAAMELEFRCDAGGGSVEVPAPYELDLRDGSGGAIVVDWEPLVRGVIDDVRRATPVPAVARAFHTALARAILSVAQRVGERRVVLTGGCFQNARLSEETIRRLGAGGFAAYWHQRVPPNDGGVAVGQIAAYAQGRLFERVE